MARIQLRDTTIFMQDGLSGTTDVNQATLAALATTCTVYQTAISATPEGNPLIAAGQTDIIPVGARFTVPGGNGTVFTVTARTPSDGSAATTDITFTPAIDADNTAVQDDSLTILPQRIEIKIGDGDLSWTEARNFEYDLDRDQLDTVRQGEDVPLSVDLAFTFEYVTSGTGEPITPVDALKRINGAIEWRSSSSDPCEPYAVDIYVIHNIPCGTNQDQDFLLPDFRWESLEYSIADAAISVSGQCNVTEIVTTRADDIV